MSERSMPFYCPYCCDEDLRPHGPAHGEWECRACRRVFALAFRGLVPASDDADGSARLEPSGGGDG